MSNTKYRLKQWYPTLPKSWKRLLEKDEVIVELVEHSFCLLRKPEGCGVRLRYEEVTLSPDFWEKVEEEYEILDKDYIPGYRTPGTTDNPDMWKIKSIKRLSDNAIFTIGDKVYNPNCKSQTFVIESFYLDCNNKHMLCGSGHINITKIEHCKEPLFISEDGVEMFEGDNCYLVHLPLGNKTEIYHASKFRKELLPNPSYRLIFATKEATEKYLDENKPMYSKKDMIDFVWNIFPNPKEYWANVLELYLIAKEE